MAQHLIVKQLAQIYVLNANPGNQPGCSELISKLWALLGCWRRYQYVFYQAHSSCNTTMCKQDTWPKFFFPFPGGNDTAHTQKESTGVE